MHTKWHPTVETFTTNKRVELGTTRYRAGMSSDRLGELTVIIGLTVAGFIIVGAIVWQLAAVIGL